MIKEFSGEYQFLSNFEPCVVYLDGMEFPTVEHAYQAAKTLDPQQKEVIQQCETASQSKRMGRRVTIRPDWEDIKLGVMEVLLVQKFKGYEHFKEALLATGNRDIEEGNWWGDTFWGVCKGEGENHLGNLLMKIRKELT